VVSRCQTVGKAPAGFESHAGEIRTVGTREQRVVALREADRESALEVDDGRRRPAAAKDLAPLGLRNVVATLAERQVPDRRENHTVRDVEHADRV